MWLYEVNAVVLGADDSLDALDCNAASKAFKMYRI